jgi:hypothetical protein
MLCDNTKSKYDIRNFKFKLFRQVVSKDPQTGVNTVTETVVFSKKEPGLGANKSSKREFAFEIPSTMSLKNNK